MFQVGDVVFHNFSYGGIKHYGFGKVNAVKDGKIYVQFKNVKGLRIFKLSVAKEVLKKMRP